MEGASCELLGCSAREDDPQASTVCLLAWTGCQLESSPGTLLRARPFLCFGALLLLHFASLKRIALTPHAHRHRTPRHFQKISRDVTPNPCGAEGTMEGAVSQAPLVCPGHSRGVVQVSFRCPYFPQNNLTQTHQLTAYPLMPSVWPLDPWIHSNVTPDGVFLLSACLDAKPMVRRGDTGDWIGTFEGHKGAVWSAKLDTPALRAATGSADFSARLWDALTGNQLLELNCSHIVKSVDFSPCNKQLLCAGKFKKLKIFDLEKGASVVEMDGHTAGVKGGLYAPNGTTVFSGGEDRVMRVWDVKSGAQIKSFEVKKEITSVQLNCGGEVITFTAGTEVHFLDTTVRFPRCREGLCISTCVC